MVFGILVFGSSECDDFYSGPFTMNAENKNRLAAFISATHW